MHSQTLLILNNIINKASTLAFCFLNTELLMHWQSIVIGALGPLQRFWRRSILLSSRIAWNSSMMAQDSSSMKMETVRPYFHHILLVKVSYKAGLDWRGRKMDPTPRREEWYACTGRGRIIWGPSLTTIIVHHLATILVPPTCKTILTPYPKSLVPWWH